MKKTLIIATRAGSLAIAQTGIVISLLRKLFPTVDIRIKKIASEGDEDRRTSLWQLKTAGFFTSRLEDALLAGVADAAVHSFKDLPIAQREGLTIAAVLDRKFPEDCLVCAKRIASIDELPEKARVGTSSLRRKVLLKRLRDDLECVPIRGNVTTRLEKLEQGEFDAIILARAGLDRLSMSSKISLVFDPAQFIPVPAQGALAVQIRADDAETKEIISKLDDKIARITTTTERMVFSALQCGCHAPAGAFAKMTPALSRVEGGDQITISAFYSEPQGEKLAQSVVSGPVGEAEKLAERLALNLRPKNNNT